ncbi:MAG TPA: magnesium/cobalt transporter CorA [Armatimonadetes bacterium]|nr:magnesium/cobalt transporter CorA [Armatimonadota bacterium]
MTRLLVHHARHGFEPNVSVEKLTSLLADPEILLWLDLHRPTPEEIALLHQAFDFHPLAVEDVVHASQRPKIEKYEGYLFIVLYAVSSLGASEGLRPKEVALFVGPNYLVTVHPDEVPVVGEVAALWQASDQASVHNITWLLYLLLDAIVDDYFPAVDTLADRTDELEDRILAEEETDALQAIFELKRTLLTLRRIIAPERDVVNMLMRHEHTFIDARYLAYLQDVYDHLARLTDSIDVFRDILASALDAHLSVVSNRLNQVMKTLTALSAMLMTSGLVAAIYGMNFRRMPELEWTYGYPFALLLMLGIVVALGLFFYRKGWL